jgi:hypothetical protein
MIYLYFDFSPSANTTSVDMKRGLERKIHTKNYTLGYHSKYYV